MTTSVACVLEERQRALDDDINKPLNNTLRTRSKHGLSRKELSEGLSIRYGSKATDECDRYGTDRGIL